MTKEVGKFIPGLTLCRLYYQDEIKPILDNYYPNIKYSAALFGYGSEVLGYDTPISTDHHWGPRAYIFLSEDDYRTYRDGILTTLSENLPYRYLGYPTNFGMPGPDGARHLLDITSGPVNHMIEIFTTRAYFELRLGINPFKEFTIEDWLSFPQQRLLEMTSGEVFHDGLEELNTIRNKFSYYPNDIWLYLMASQWSKISQEEAFVGRCADVGDELGSQIVAARIIRELMRLCFLLEKRYAPYSKWLGIAFSRLSSGKELTPVFKKVLLADSREERETYLSEAYIKVAELHNSKNITEPLPAKVSQYYGRPYLVLHADKFAEAVRRRIMDRNVRTLNISIGSLD